MSHSQFPPGARKPLSAVPPGTSGSELPNGVQELGKSIGAMLKGKPKPYVSVVTSLEDIDMEINIMQIELNGVMTECLVIPTQELIYKEWQHMTGGKFTSEEVTSTVDNNE